MSVLPNVITAGGNGTNELNYVPEFVVCSGPADFAAQDTTLQVSVDGLAASVLLNLNAAGFTSVGSIEQFGPVRAGSKIFRLADGQIKVPGGRCVIFGTSAAGTDVVVSEFSTRRGLNLTRTQQEQILAGTPKEFEKFDFLSLANAAADDVVTVEYNDARGNLVESRLEVQQLPGMFMQGYGGTGALIGAGDAAIIDNSLGVIKRVTVTAAADNNAYVRRTIPGQVTSISDFAQ